MALAPGYIAGKSALARLRHPPVSAVLAPLILPDLLIAAVAERASRTVLHYDADYDIVAAITGQPAQWVVPRGTVP
jgi:predicted nucleic acid-binding protein